MFVVCYRDNTPKLPQLYKLHSNFRVSLEMKVKKACFFFEIQSFDHDNDQLLKAFSSLNCAHFNAVTHKTLQAHIPIIYSFVQLCVFGLQQSNN